MPTYDYACEACGASYELRQGFDAETTHTCEECRKGTAKRVLHPPRVHFKGSGWYATDSRKSTSAVNDSPTPEAAKESKPAESKPAKAASASGDSSAAAAG